MLAAAGVTLPAFSETSRGGVAVIDCPRTLTLTRTRTLTRILTLTLTLTRNLTLALTLTLTLTSSRRRASSYLPSTRPRAEAWR